MLTIDKNIQYNVERILTQKDGRTLGLRICECAGFKPELGKGTRNGEYSGI